MPNNKLPRQQASNKQQGNKQGYKPATSKATRPATNKATSQQQTRLQGQHLLYDFKIQPWSHAKLQVKIILDILTKPTFAQYDSM
jgi:hypothetical protein